MGGGDCFQRTGARQAGSQAGAVDGRHLRHGRGGGAGQGGRYVEVLRSDAVMARNAGHRGDGARRYQYNPRLQEVMRDIPKGTIYDRNRAAARGPAIGICWKNIAPITRALESISIKPARGAKVGIILSAA